MRALVMRRRAYLCVRLRGDADGCSASRVLLGAWRGVATRAKYRARCGWAEGYA